MAREIHDELGQALTAIKIDLSSLSSTSCRQRLHAKSVESILKLVDETIQSVRRISTELRPGILDDLGLVAAVEWAAEEFRGPHRDQVPVGLTARMISRSIQERATAMFRIFQETLTNVARHAKATG